ncbi:hypothetical protein BU25DRAFT_417183 [Macroventuria anomochaeta]|uniref:Uncharacterized protein n=1 Tax=Macroventuria anomochaeta TaxID=301207 RepID=A0ACB6SH14_9PLEO|nr:uncharacterized protein BU25DRAFT_417183 [Macroventuria anomochaeta]KAF2632559.1 hypothetical protein BU25DRAFT_417183 [Macroventuria anomochaeta]
MTEVMAQQGVTLAAPSSRHDVVSELLDNYTCGDSYDAEDVSPKSSLAPAFKELPSPPPRTDSLRDPKAKAIQRMHTKFQLREDDDSSISSHGSRNGSLDQTPRTRITSRSLSRSGTPPSLKLFVSNGATAHIPPTPIVYAPVKPLPSSVVPDTKELPPPPPERSIKRKEVQAAVMGHKPSKSELERNDSFHSQSEGRSSIMGQSETAAAAPPVKRKAVPGAGVKKFVSLLELHNRPRGDKPAAAPTSAPRKISADQEVGVVPSSNAAPSKIPVRKEAAASNQLPPTPPEKKSVPSPPRKALVGVGLPSNPRTKQPMSPLHTRGKSSTGFNILKAQRPAPPIPTMRKEAATPEMTPSPTLKPEIRMDNEISPMKPLPPPTENRRLFSYGGPGEQQQGSLKQKDGQQETQQLDEKKIEQQKQGDETKQLAPPTADPTPSSHSAFPLRTTSLDPPESSPAIRPSTAPTSQSSFATTHPSLSTHILAPTLPEESSASAYTSIPEPPFIPLTRQPIPLCINLIPRITASQLSCYTQHKTNVWSNNVFQPMGCMICHANEKDQKFVCTWCQLRICRGCSEELMMVPGRDLGRLLEVREGEMRRDGKSEVRVVVEDVDLEEEAYEEEGVVDSEDGSEETERGRSMTKVDSRERAEWVTPRD